MASRASIPQMLTQSRHVMTSPSVATFELYERKGTLDEVAYSLALFWAPLSVLFSLASVVLVITIVGVFLLPLVGIAALVLNVYFAYLATESSLNLEPGGKTWSVLLLAALGSFLVSFLVALIIG